MITAIFEGFGEKEFLKAFSELEDIEDDCVEQQSAQMDTAQKEEIDDKNNDDIDANVQEEYFESNQQHSGENANILPGDSAIEPIREIETMIQSEGSFCDDEEIIETDDEHLSADDWIVRMKSIQEASTFGELKLDETIRAGINAITCAGETELNTIKYIVFKYQIERAIELLELSRQNIEDTDAVLQCFYMFNDVDPQTAPNRAYEFDKEYLNLFESVAIQACDMVKLIPDVDLAMFEDLPERIIVCGERYTELTKALTNRLDLYDMQLTSDALESRQRGLDELKGKAEKAIVLIEEKRETERRKKHEDYWSEHYQERIAYESEQSSIASRIKSLEQDISNAESTLNTTANQLRALLEKRNKLGIFRIKEKKETENAIAELHGRQRQQEEELNNRKRAYATEVQRLTNRLNEITIELQKERT